MLDCHLLSNDVRVDKVYTWFSDKTFNKVIPMNYFHCPRSLPLLVLKLTSSLANWAHMQWAKKKITSILIARRDHYKRILGRTHIVITIITCTKSNLMTSYLRIKLLLISTWRHRAHLHKLTVTIAHNEPFYPTVHDQPPHTVTWHAIIMRS